MTGSEQKKKLNKQSSNNKELLWHCTRLPTVPVGSLPVSLESCFAAAGYYERFMICVRFSLFIKCRFFLSFCG